MTLNDIVNAIAAATDMTYGRVYTHARRLQEVGVIPTGSGGRNAPACDTEHVALVLFSLLSGVPLRRAFAASLDYGRMKNDTSDALSYIAKMLDVVAEFDGEPSDASDALKLVFKSHITVVAGDRPAVVVRYTCTDDPLEVAFTPDGEAFHPEITETVSEARSLPGVLLFRIGRALREISA